MCESTKTVEEKKVNLTKEEANKILDRIIGFVGNCDNKSSIVLAMYGVLFAIIFSTDAITNLIVIAKNILLFDECIKIFLFIFFAGSGIVIFIGFLLIILSLIAKIDCKQYKQDQLNLNSVIYFKDIAEKYSSYKNYAETLLQKTDDDYKNDIISQIYLNSSICSKKFKKYKNGVVFSIFGLAGFGITLVLYLAVF